MESYRDLSGASPIVKYEVGGNWFKAWFERDPVPYRYRAHVAELARLARTGRGLATFINRHKAGLPFTRG